MCIYWGERRRSGVEGKWSLLPKSPSYFKTFINLAYTTQISEKDTHNTQGKERNRKEKEKKKKKKRSYPLCLKSRKRNTK